MKKINFKSVFYGVNFTIFIIALVTSLMTFVGRDIKTVYSSQIVIGFGLISLFVGWLYNLTAWNAQYKYFLIKNIVALALIVIAMSMVGSVAGFITASFYIISIIVTIILKQYDKF